MNQEIIQKKLTLTANEETYIRANYNRMTMQEMANNLKITKSKVRYNIQIMELQPFTKGRYKNHFQSKKVAPGCFDVSGYAKNAFI